MRVVVESGANKGFGIQYHLKMLDGYRAGELVRNGDLELPLFDVDRPRLVAWAQNTGYEVVSEIDLSSPISNELAAGMRR